MGVSGEHDLKAPDTNPEAAEEFDEHRALRTMAAQVASIYSQMPDIVETMRELVAWKRESERRIIRLEGIAQELQAAQKT